ncbi:MAG: hypothetical protein MI799_16385, partial [Desulfobacterales bacterium]|nr:hypothetical protein [Desulfobacterales bacterium]
MGIKTTITCLAAASILGAGFVQAREPAATSMETVIVTAQKQEENVQEVPMSISVMNETAIEDSMIKSVGDISDHVPSL